METKMNQTKDNIIARQSQMTAALTYFNLVGKKPKLSDVVRVAALLEKFIMDGYSKNLNEAMERADEKIETIQEITH